MGTFESSLFRHVLILQLVCLHNETLGIDVLLSYVFILHFKALKCILLNFIFMLLAIKLLQHGLTDVYSCRNSVVVVVVVVVVVFVVVVLVVVVVFVVLVVVVAIVVVVFVVGVCA